MKKLVFALLTLTFSLSFFSCKKKNTGDPVQTPTNPFYIRFTLDGAAKSYTSTYLSTNTGFGGGSSTSSGIFNFQDDVSINLNMPLDSIMGSDLQALVGQKIAVGSCGAAQRTLICNVI